MRLGKEDSDMANQIAFTVRQVSAVLVSASAIDPQSILPEILSNANVVPADWVAVGSNDTPFGAITRYQNGIIIWTDDNRCVFQQPIHGNLRRTYEIFPTAQRYAAASTLVPYNAIGINWSLDVPVTAPEIWMREKMMSNVSNFSDFFPTSLQIAKQLDFAFCNLTFRAENAQITIDFNYHFPLSRGLPGDVAEILISWPRYQEHLTRDLLSKF